MTALCMQSRHTGKGDVLPADLAVQGHKVLDHDCKQAAPDDCSRPCEGQPQQGSHVQHLQTWQQLSCRSVLRHLGAGVGSQTQLYLSGTVSEDVWNSL